MKKILTSLLIFLGGTLVSWSQSRVISGVVKGLPENESLPGVNILVKGTSNGAVTDINGFYEFSVENKDSVLVFYFIGYKKQEIVVGDQLVVDVLLAPDLIQLNEAVVTALGITREEKSLTYAAQEIKSEELNQVKDASFINGLSGKAAGVFINKSASGIGGSSKVVLRGNGSTRNNNVLYVIDGVPMLNSVSSQATDVFGQGNEIESSSGTDSGDGISNLNPDDIESISILRGASAAALYGSQAGNGAILITTKKGEAGIAKINFSSNLTFETPLLLPSIQNSYGRDGGAGQLSWSNSKLSMPANDNLEDFFGVGKTWINSISISGGNKTAQTYFSYANTDASGITPNNEFSRHNFNFKETAILWDEKLNISANVSFISQSAKNRATSGLYFNGLAGTYLFPRDADFNTYKNDFEKFNPLRNLNDQNWVVSADAQDFFQNPYWIANRAQSSDKRNRVIAAASFSYKINDWLDLKLRGNVDKAFDEFRHEIHAGSSPVLSDYNGRFILRADENSQFYGETMLGAKKNINDISIAAFLGAITIDRTSESKVHDSKGAGEPIPGVNQIPGLTFSNIFSLQNISQPRALHNEIYRRSRLNSLFTSVNLGYQGFLYLDVTARNDWSSTLAFTNDVSFFYPSIGLSCVVTEKIEITNVDLLKFRASYAEVGNPLEPLDNNAPNIINSKTGSSTLPKERVAPGTTLKPERNTSYEFGVQMAVFDNKLSLDFTYYNSSVDDQRVVIEAPPADGGGFYTINGGEIRNRGVEALFSVTPVDNDNFSYNTSLNFTLNRNRVMSLSDIASNKFILTKPGVNAYASELREGQPFGLILGKRLLRNADGSLVKDDDGKPVLDFDENNNDQFFVLGNPNPDFMLGLTNTFRYKNIQLNFLIDGRFGGEVFSLTEAILDEYGVSQRTADDRDKGEVNIEGASFNPQTYYNTVGGRAGVLDEYKYDATNIRLREMSIGYVAPEKITNRFGFVSKIKLSIVSRNVFFFLKRSPFDPEISLSTNNGLQGLDVFSLPATRSIGFNLSLSL